MSNPLLNNPFSRIVQIGLKGIETKVLCDMPKRGISTRVVDYMHLPNFLDVVNQKAQISDLFNVRPNVLALFTYEKQVHILTALVSGGRLEDALATARVPKSTWETWQKLADNNIQPYEGFMLECAAAQGYFGLEIVQELRKKGSTPALIELWRIHHPETVLNQGTQNNVHVNVAFIDRPAEERKVELARQKEVFSEDDIRGYNIKDI